MRHLEPSFKLVGGVIQKPIEGRWLWFSLVLLGIRDSLVNFIKYVSPSGLDGESGGVSPNSEKREEVPH